MGIELLHLQSVQSFSHSDADPNGHPNSNGDTNADANSYAHSNANANAHSDSDTNADRNPNSNAYSGQHSCDAAFLAERRDVFEKSGGARFLQYGGRNHLLHD